MVGVLKSKRDMLKRELTERYQAVMQELGGYAVTSPTDAAPKGKRWVRYEDAVKIDETKLSIACGDFKVILDELKRLK